MADNLGYTQGVGSTVATEEVTTLNGVAVTTQHAQRIAPVIITANSTAVDIIGDQTNGIDVDVTRVSGNVTVVQPTGSNLNAAVTGTVTANAGTGSFTVAQATAANLNATVTGTVTANAGTGNFTVAQATAGNLNATVVGSGNFTVVQPTASNLNANVSGTVTANAGTGNFTVTQSTAGSLATKTSGAVTTAAPTYTTGTDQPLSLTTAGALRVDPSGVTSPVSIASAVTVAQATAANLNATVTGTVTANAGTGNFTVQQATAGNLNATVVQATATNLNATVVQPTAANLNATVTLASGTNYAGRVRLTDGTSDLSVDTLYNDAESATENHLNVGARLHALNPAGTFDLVRHSVSGFKAATYTTAQTSTVLWTPAAGKALVITHLQIQSYGTTAGTCVVYFGTAAYTRNTNLPLFDGEFAPSATIKTSVVIPFTTPVRSAVNDSIRVTTTGAQSVTVVAIGYEI